MIKAFTVSILSMFFSSVQIAFINENTEGYLEKSGTFGINSGHLYKKGDCPGKHGTTASLNSPQKRQGLVSGEFQTSVSFVSAAEVWIQFQPLP
jgi:hypothetical protein